MSNFFTANTYTQKSFNPAIIEDFTLFETKFPTVGDKVMYKSKFYNVTANTSGLSTVGFRPDVYPEFYNLDDSVYQYNPNAIYVSPIGNPDVAKELINDNYFYDNPDYMNPYIAPFIFGSARGGTGTITSNVYEETLSGVTIQISFLDENDNVMTINESTNHIFVNNNAITGVQSIKINVTITGTPIANREVFTNFYVESSNTASASTIEYSQDGVAFEYEQFFTISTKGSPTSVVVDNTGIKTFQIRIFKVAAGQIKLYDMFLQKVENNNDYFFRLDDKIAYNNTYYTINYDDNNINFFLSRNLMFDTTILTSDYFSTLPNITINGTTRAFQCVTKLRRNGTLRDDFYPIDKFDYEKPNKENILLTGRYEFPSAFPNFDTTRNSVKLKSDGLVIINNGFTAGSDALVTHDYDRIVLQNYDFVGNNFKHNLKNCVLIDSYFQTLSNDVVLSDNTYKNSFYNVYMNKYVPINDFGSKYFSLVQDYQYSGTTNMNNLHIDNYLSGSTINYFGNSLTNFKVKNSYLLDVNMVSDYNSSIIGSDKQTFFNNREFYDDTFNYSIIAGLERIPYNFRNGLGRTNIGNTELGLAVQANDINIYGIIKPINSENGLFEYILQDVLANPTNGFTIQTSYIDTKGMSVDRIKLLGCENMFLNGMYDNSDIIDILDGRDFVRGNTLLKAQGDISTSGTISEQFLVDGKQIVIEIDPLLFQGYRIRYRLPNYSRNINIEFNVGFKISVLGSTFQTAFRVKNSSDVTIAEFIKNYGAITTLPQFETITLSNLNIGDGFYIEIDDLNKVGTGTFTFYLNSIVIRSVTPYEKFMYRSPCISLSTPENREYTFGALGNTPINNTPPTVYPQVGYQPNTLSPDYEFDYSNTINLPPPNGYFEVSFATNGGFDLSTSDFYFQMNIANNLANSGRTFTYVIDVSYSKAVLDQFFDVLYEDIATGKTYRYKHEKRTQRPFRTKHYITVTQVTNAPIQLRMRIVSSSPNLGTSVIRLHSVKIETPNLPTDFDKRTGRVMFYSKFRIQRPDGSIYTTDWLLCENNEPIYIVSPNIALLTQYMTNTLSNAALVPLAEAKVLGIELGFYYPNDIYMAGFTIIGRQNIIKSINLTDAYRKLTITPTGTIPNLTTNITESNTSDMVIQNDIDELDFEIGRIPQGYINVPFGFTRRYKLTGKARSTVLRIRKEKLNGQQLTPPYNNLDSVDIDIEKDF